MNYFHPPVTQLARDGEYAGNDAIVAFARAHSTNVVIHQHNAPRWEVLTPGKGSTCTLHIAYLNGEHYCSVESLVPAEKLPPVAATKVSQSLYLPALILCIDIFMLGYYLQRMLIIVFMHQSSVCCGCFVHCMNVLV